MKTGKKIIAMVLAIVLALSVMPMAFSAEECEHVFNTETLERPRDPMGKGYYICSACNKTVYVEMANLKDFYMALYEWYTIVEDVYIYQKTFDPEMHNYFYEKFAKIEDDYYPKSGLWVEPEQETVDDLTRVLNELTEEYRNYLIEIGAVRVVDTSEYTWCETIGTVNIYFDYTVEEISILNNFSEEAQNKAFKSREAVSEYLSKVRNNPEEASQEEFDKLAEDCIAYIKAIYNCLENNHQFTKGTDNADGTHSLCCYYCTAPAEQTAAHEWGEYISNGDATVNSDGTKTAECIYCEATDTVTDEGSRIDDDTTVLITYIVEFLKLLIEFIKSVFVK